ncbi:hypothetical protein NPIL_582941 [Nephila pilipes]|uniref:Uncharacterized protein n=1 Tax=Nephila pilipes TaxID=299642 RepID=A0A8X6PE48_NEPPI|nr:hypothetical protein NPIL_582941 [Nephila pilipes]
MILFQQTAEQEESSVHFKQSLASTLNRDRNDSRLPARSTHRSQRPRSETNETHKRNYQPHHPISLSAIVSVWALADSIWIKGPSGNKRPVVRKGLQRVPWKQQIWKTRHPSPL